MKITRSAFLASAFLLATPIASFAQAKTAPMIAVIETSKGTIKVRLFPEDAPKTVENFVTLARKGFYNGTAFHRVVPGFVIQGGDPLSKKLPEKIPAGQEEEIVQRLGVGTGGPGYSIKNENNKVLKHNRGAVAMANAGRDTAGSQFYIVIDQPAYSLDEKYDDGVNKYTLFGQVISGQQDVAEKIKIGDKIKKITIQGGGK